MEIMGVDIVIWGIFLFIACSPFILVAYELYKRRQFPIRAGIIQNWGEGGFEKQTIDTWDRIGDFEQKDFEGKKTGAVVWKLRSNGKIVQGFNTKNVFDMKIWFGFKTVKVCFIKAISGMKGEEFYPHEYNDAAGFRPVYTPDRAAVGAAIDQDIEERHRRQSWLERNWRDLLKAGFEMLIVIMLFLNFMTMRDVVNGLGGVAASIHEDTMFRMNKTINTTVAKPVTSGSLIPFAGG